MSHTFAALTTAAAFVWLDTALAISFVEAPPKFRAPGLGIGRIVFRALNRAELVLAACVAAEPAYCAGGRSAPGASAGTAGCFGGTGGRRR